jgi:hypothetical protein
MRAASSGDTGTVELLCALRTSSQAQPQSQPSLARERLRQEVLQRAECVKEFRTFVGENHVLIEQPAMDNETFEALIGVSDLAGHQKGKDRGTFQSSTLDMLAADSTSPIGAWLERIESCAAGPDGEVVNKFFNINGGRYKKGVHKDKFTRGATGRVICYLMQKGQTASLRVLRDDMEFEIEVPEGCAIYCTQALLEKCDHAHGANGVCISGVLEVSRVMPVGASAAAIAEASAAQPALPFHVLMPWEPENRFFGDVLDWCYSPGSVEKCAVAYLRGPKLGRGRPRKMTAAAARELVDAMTPAELKAAASAQMTQVWDKAAEAAGFGTGKEARSRLAKQRLDELSAAAGFGTGEEARSLLAQQRCDEQAAAAGFGKGEEARSLLAQQRCDEQADASGFGTGPEARWRLQNQRLLFPGQSVSASVVEAAALAKVNARIAESAAELQAKRLKRAATTAAEDAFADSPSEAALNGLKPSQLQRLLDMKADKTWSDMMREEWTRGYKPELRRKVRREYGLPPI